MSGSRPMLVSSTAATLLTMTAQVNAQNADELAKQLSNPITSLTNVPMQFNYDEGFAEDGSRVFLNMQPVIPVSISDEWNMISRTIVPLISQDDILTGSGSQSSVGPSFSRSKAAGPGRRARDAPNHRKRSSHPR